MVEQKSFRDATFAPEIHRRYIRGLEGKIESVLVQFAIDFRLVRIVDEHGTPVERHSFLMGRLYKTHEEAVEDGVRLAEAKRQWQEKKNLSKSPKKNVSN